MTKLLMANFILNSIEIISIIAIVITLWRFWKMAQPLFKLNAFLDLVNLDIYDEAQGYKKALNKYKKYLAKQSKARKKTTKKKN